MQMLMCQCYMLNHLPSAAGDSIYSVDNQKIPVYSGCPIRLETAFFNDRSGEFGLFQARAVDTGNSHRLTARLY